MSTPRSHKRKIPVIPTDEDQEEAAPIAAPAPVAPVAPVEPALVVASPSKKVEPENEEDAYTAEEEERARIWDMFAEEYHDIVAELPLEYQRNFFLIQELENTQQGCTSALKTHLQSYLSALTTPTAPASPVASTSAPSYVDEEDGPSPYVRQTLNSIAKAARSAVRAGEDKVGLAVTLYEAVDRHIRRLDADLAKYEDSLVIGLRAGTLPSHDAPSLSLKSPPGRTTSRGAIALGEKDPHGENAPAGGSPKRRGSAMGPEMDGERKRVKELQRMEKRKTDAMGRSMPIDPSEPTYCICGRVSFGDMIGCDNDDCAREWFHYECVGLDRPPLGKWFCTDCVHLAGTASVDTPPKKSHQKRIR